MANLYDHPYVISDALLLVLTHITDMKNKQHALKPPCSDYTLARTQDLVVIPEGAVWGGRDDQPVEMRKGVPLKKEKGVDDGDAEVSDAEVVDDDEGTQPEGSDAVTLLRDIKELVEQLVSLKRKELDEAERDVSEEAEIDELVGSDTRSEEQPPPNQPKRKRELSVTAIYIYTRNLRRPCRRKA